MAISQLLTAFLPLFDPYLTLFFLDRVFQAVAFGCFWAGVWVNFELIMRILSIKKAGV